MKWIFWLLSSLCFTSAMAGESSTYDFSWLDKDKAVYVLQNRTFRKSGTVYVGGTFGMTTSGTFTDATVMQGRAGYFFKEEWGIEFIFSKNSGKTNETFDNVQEAGADVFYRKVNSYSGGMLLWSPFYAKINTFDQIIYFDWFFGLGYANVNSTDNRSDFIVPTVSNVTTSTSGILLASGIRAYINESWSLRIDLTNLRYNDDYLIPQATVAARKELFSNTDFTIGLNYAF
ncbi:MAG: outer membrane beta-barrel domain-containing protein [Bacteriovoracaceae bacterium]|nr:outer membrane beta-barrel domain-containing protein [Bacteriovoracaceae bacterium]